MNISFICTLCNRWPAFALMLESLQAAMAEDDEVVIVDFASTDLPDPLPSDPRIVWVKLDRPFRNSFGNNRGAEAATKEVVCFTHADMDYPKDVRTIILGAVAPGKFWNPLWHDLKENGDLGAFRPTAYGVLACLKEKAPGWDETMDGHWGGEDRKLARDCESMGMRAVREHVRGLVHRYHSNDPGFLQKHM